jgi:cell division inhibitor SulA
MIDATPSAIRFNNERTSKNTCLKFDVDWVDGSSTKQAIYQLVDFENQEVTELAFPILKDLSTKPTQLCWFCPQNSISNKCVCQKHLHKADWLFDFIKQ